MAGSNYFEEIEFEVTKSPGTPERPATIVKANKKKFDSAVEAIEIEMRKIQSGDSKFTHYAIATENFGSPVGNALTRMKTDPTLENIKGFVQLAGQDLGGSAQSHFKKILAETLEEVPNV
jgi:hypothetical protein